MADVFLGSAPRHAATRRTWHARPAPGHVWPEGPDERKQARPHGRACAPPILPHNPRCQDFRAAARRRKAAARQSAAQQESESQGSGSAASLGSAQTRQGRAAPGPAHERHPARRALPVSDARAATASRAPAPCLADQPVLLAWFARGEPSPSNPASAPDNHRENRDLSRAGPEALPPAESRGRASGLALRFAWPGLRLPHAPPTPAPAAPPPASRSARRAPARRPASPATSRPRSSPPRCRTGW